MKQFIKYGTPVLFALLTAFIVAPAFAINPFALFMGLILSATVLHYGFNFKGVLGEFIAIGADDTPEVKAGKEQLNVAFKSLDKKTQDSLSEYQKVQKELTDSVMQKSTSLESQLVEFKAQADKDGKTRDEQIADLTKALTEMNKAKITQDEAKRKSFGDVISEGFETLGKSVDEQIAKIKQFTANKNAGMSINLKAAANVMTVISGAVAPDYQPIVGPPHELYHARNFIPVSPTISNLIRYIRFNPTTNLIQPVAPGVLKNQIDYVETLVDAAVVKIAGWINVQDEFLEDIVGATSFLSAELPMALYDAEDLQIFKGSGATNNIAGLYSTAAALTLPYGPVNVTSNNIDLLAGAATYVRRQKRIATAAWTSPEDYLAILINKSSGATQVYTYPVRFNDNNNMLYIGDFPVIQHTVFNPGEGFVGDFARGCRIFQKADATMRFSTENVDNFVKNVTTVLIEERIALANFYPESFVKVLLNTYYS